MRLCLSSLIFICFITRSPHEEWPRSCDLRGKNGAQVRRLSGREYEERNMMIPKSEDILAQELGKVRDWLPNSALWWK